MSQQPTFQFQRGNTAKLLAIPLYLLGLLCALVVPRQRGLWVFGSAAGCSGGALAVALQARETTVTVGRETAQLRTVWLLNTAEECAAAEAAGWEAVRKASVRGWWLTLRAHILVVTHGLGDVNRFGVFGGTVIQLWHGAPLKKIHFDSPITTAVSGPGFLRPLLKRMYERGARTVSLYVAGSDVAAARMRTAFRAEPGKVRVLGEPRTDSLADAHTPDARTRCRRELRELLRLDNTVSDDAAWILWAPTWRDGGADPSIPNPEELEQLRATLAQLDAVLFVRPHPLGAGAYASLYGERIHPLPPNELSDPTAMLPAFDTLITDYSSIAVDFATTERATVWFAPDLAHYAATRGLYEPLEVTALGRVDHSWGEVCARLAALADPNGNEARAARSASRALRDRFYAFRDGRSAARVVEAIVELTRPAADLVPDDAVFFESFYGRGVTCNPLAIDREIARRFPQLPRYWSVTSEAQRVPDGAVPVLVGSRLWHAARERAQLLVVNDWLRYRFRARPHQCVLQTWHGTMLKHLALGRPKVSLRTRLAIHREARRWTLLLSQNPHSSDQFRRNYAFRGELLETGYPRNDELAHAAVGEDRLAIHTRTARRELDLPPNDRVVAYIPTWRDRGTTPGQLLDLEHLANRLAERTGQRVWILVRGHSRVAAPTALAPTASRVVNVTDEPSVNRVMLAADAVITDYSSVMFDATVANIPLVFYTPDYDHYAEVERGFTFDFAATAPGPIVRDSEALVTAVCEVLADGGQAQRHTEAYRQWRQRYNPWDDGGASARAVDELCARGALRAAAGEHTAAPSASR